MTEESQIKMFNASIKDKNLDGEYLMLMKAKDHDKIFNNSIENIIDQVIKYDKKGVGSTLAGILFAKEISESSQTLCNISAYKLSLWTLHNSLLKTKLPIKTNLLKMEEEGNKEELFKRCIKGIKSFNEIVSYSATTHFLELVDNKVEMINYLIRLNSNIFDLGGITLSQLGIFIKYIAENDFNNIKKLIALITKRYAFINRIDTQPHLKEIRHKLKKDISKIVNCKNTKKILSREEIHGASEGFLMLKYNEVDELIVELQSRNIGYEEFLNVLWLAALKRALLFNHKNRDFRANKSLGWLLSTSGITYLHGIKYITSASSKLGLKVNEEIICDWIINVVWLILDSQKVSLQGKELVDRLNAISPKNIKKDNTFSYGKMVEFATHLYTDEAIKEAFGFVYVNPESSFEVVCQMINYLFEYDNGDELVETSFLRLASALLDIVRSNFATMLGSYSSALIALTLANRTIFNFGKAHSRFELVDETSKMYG